MVVWSDKIILGFQIKIFDTILCGKASGVLFSTGKHTAIFP